MGLICGAATAGALLLSSRPARISYAITVCDEVEEIRRLIDILGGIDIRDEIVIQYDEPKTPPAVMDYLQALRGERNCGAIVPFALNNDFAAFKNNVKKFCRGTIFSRSTRTSIPAHRCCRKYTEFYRQMRQPMFSWSRASIRSAA
jgi:hypothetical protein